MKPEADSDKDGATEPLSAELDLSAQRKRRDLAALLPIIGALFFISPLVSTLNQSENANVTGTAIYIFSIWAVLIVGAFVLSKALRAEKHSDIKDK